MDFQKTLSELLMQFHASQVEQNVAFQPGLITKWPPHSYEQIGGLWPSLVCSFVSSQTTDPLSKILSWLIEEFDICVDFNFYTNIWILRDILEAQELGIDLGFDDKTLAKTCITLTQSFQGLEDSDSPAIYFWPKKVPVNPDELVNVSLPTNLTAKFGFFFELFKNIFDLFASVGLSDWAEENLHVLSPKRMQIFFRGFKIPQDFDDSSLFIVVGSYLKENVDQYPNLAQLWSTNVERFVEILLHCAYEPFSQDFSKSTIDTRTYFWLRPFLEEVAHKSRDQGVVPHVILPTTWMQTLDEACAIRNANQGGYISPAITNVIDAAVCANVLYALTFAVSSEPSTEWFKPKVQKIYADTVSMIAWLIESETVNKRSDIIVAYYPDVEPFYFFVARVLKKLRHLDPKKINSFPILSDACCKLEKAMIKATEVLLKTSSTTAEGLVFWDGILGKGKDRLYITAACVNAILDTWTRQTPDNKLSFITETSDVVKQTLKAAFNFLVKYATSGDYPLMNALFSGTIKSTWTYQTRYPANTTMYTDGTRVDHRQTPFREIYDNWGGGTRSYVHGFTGVVPDSDYQKLLEERQFDLEPGMEKHPYSHFSYWSVEDATRSMIIVAIAKYQAVAEI